MMIHLSRIQHAGVDVTVKAVSNKMFVPEKLGAVVKKIRTDCSRCRIMNICVSDCLYHDWSY